MGGTTVNDLRIVSCGTQLPVVLLTLQIGSGRSPRRTFGTWKVVDHVEDPGKKKFVKGVALPVGSQSRRISSSPLPGTRARATCVDRFARTTRRLGSKPRRPWLPEIRCQAYGETVCGGDWRRADRDLCMRGRTGLAIRVVQGHLGGDREDATLIDRPSVVGHQELRDSARGAAGPNRRPDC